MWIFAIVGCGKPESTPAPRRTIADAMESSGTQPVVAGAGEATVRLRFEALSPMYEGYFADPAWVQPLGKELGACTQGVADIVVSYDSDVSTGSIVLATGPRDLDCRPVQTEQGWDFAPLVPVARALAAYRDRIAGSRDFRIATFRTGIAYLRATNLCTIYLGGQYPPDGTTFSPCVDLAGVPNCVGDPESGSTTVPLGDSERSSYLAQCLGG